MDKIEFHIGIDCPFCFQQTHNTLMGSKNFSYNHIYCTHCRLTDIDSELFDSKFELWFLDEKLISVLISDNIGDRYYHSEYSPVQKEANLFQDDETKKIEDIKLDKWNLRKHIDILYNYIFESDLSNLLSKPGISLKIKEILDNPYLSTSIKNKISSDQ